MFSMSARQADGHEELIKADAAMGSGRPGLELTSTRWRFVRSEDVWGLPAAGRPLPSAEGLEGPAESGKFGWLPRRGQGLVVLVLMVCVGCLRTQQCA